MSFGNDPYASPEKFGVTVVGTVSWHDEPWEFDITCVWVDGNGTLYWGTDSGCSCPSPFENITSLSELTTGSFEDLNDYLNDALKEAKKGYNAPSDLDNRVARLIELVRGI